MIRNLLAAVAAIFLLLAAPAMAQDGAGVTIPWGNWLVFAVNNFGEIILAVVGVLFVRLLAVLPKPITDWIKTLRVEQLLERAIDYGIQATAGAAKDKKLTVSVGSEVVAQSLQYVIDRAPSKLISWMGGPNAISQMILARLDLTPEATAEAVLSDVVVIQTPAA